MPSGGILSLSVEDTEDDGGILIAIRDTGVGIASHVIPRVFEAFFTTRSGVGTGIGLSVAKQFVEGHGGRIDLESSQASNNHGTIVRILLPLVTAYEG